MTQVEEKQDFRLELAQKVRSARRLARSCSPPWGRVLRRPATPVMQVFLYKCKDTPAADKKRLQTEILDTCFNDGAARRTRRAKQRNRRSSSAYHTT